MSCLQVRTRRMPVGVPGCLMLSIFGCAVSSALAQNAPAADKAPAAPASTQPAEPAGQNPDIEAARKAALDSIRKQREEQAKAANQPAASNGPAPVPETPVDKAPITPVAPATTPVNPTTINPAPPTAAPAKPIVEPLPTSSGPPVFKLGGANRTPTEPPVPPPVSGAGKPPLPGRPKVGGAPPVGGAPAGATTSADRRKELPSLAYIAQPVDPTKSVYSFDYDNTPWPDVLQDFARVSGLTLLGDAASVTGNMSFRSARNFTYTEALHQLNELLLKRTLDKRLLERTDNYLEIWRLPDRIKQIPAEKMFDNFEQMVAANLDDFDMCLVNVDPPNGWSPFQIIESFRTLFDDYYGTQVVGNKIQLSGLVRDHHDFMKKITALAGEPEKPDARPQLTYQCIFIKANDLQGLLRQIYPATPPGPPRPGVDAKAEQAKQITILSNPAANTVIMRAPQQVLTEMGMLCKQFDVGYTPKLPIIKVIKLENAVAQTLQGVLKPISMKELQDLTKPGQSYIAPEILADKSWDVLPDIGSNSLILMGGEEGVTRAEAMVKQYDVPESGEDVKVIDLKNCDAGVIAANLAQLFPPQPKPGMPQLRIKPDGDCRLIVIGAKNDVAKVLSMATQLDTGPADDAGEHFVKLQNAKPSQMAGWLTQLFGTPGMPGVKVLKGKAIAGQPQPPGGPVKFMADDSTMTLIVVCNDREWAKVEPLIQRFDADAAYGKPELRSITLKHARARDVVAALMAMYPSLSGQPKPQAPGQPPQMSQSAERIWEDPRDGSIQVWAGKAFIDEIMPLVEKLDVEGRDGLTVIKLEHAKAVDVAPIILAAFGASGPGMAQPGVQPGRPPNMPPAASGASAVRVTAEPVTNSLLISADASEIDKITKLVADIDRESEKEVDSRVILTCEHVPAAEVAQTLMALAGAGRSGGGGMMNRQPGMPPTPGGASGSKLKVTPSGNKVVLDGPRDEVAKAVQIFPEVDTEIQRPQNVKYSVRDAEETEKALRVMLGIGGAPTAVSSTGGPPNPTINIGGGPKPSGGSQISLYANTYENTILVSALPRDFPRIEEALKIVESETPKNLNPDAPIDEGQGLPGIYVHHMKYRTAYDIGFTLEDLLKPKTGVGPSFDEGPNEKVLIVRNFKPAQRANIIKMIEMFDVRDETDIEEGIRALDADKVPALIAASMLMDFGRSTGVPISINTNLSGTGEFDTIDIHKGEPEPPPARTTTQPAAAAPVVPVTDKPISFVPAGLIPSAIVDAVVAVAIGQVDGTDESAEPMATTTKAMPENPVGLPPGVEIVPDPANNRVLIRGPKDQLDRLEKWWEKIGDVKPATVFRRFPLRYSTDVAATGRLLESIFNSSPNFSTQQQRGRGGRNQPGAAPAAPTMPGQPQPGQPQPGQPGQQPGQRPGQPGQQPVQVPQQVNMRIRVTPDANTRSLFVVALATDVPLIIEVLRSLDANTAKNQTIEMFKLQRLDANDVAQSLREVLGLTASQFGGGRRNFQMGGQPGMPGQPQPGGQPGQPQPGGQPGVAATISSDSETKITAERQTNTIIAQGSPDQLAMIRELIEKLEKEDNTQETKMVRVTLQNARATEIATIVKDVLASGGGGGGGGGGNRFGPGGGGFQGGGGGGGGGGRRSQVTVIADARTNSVILSGRPKDLIEAEKTIRDLDVKTDSDIKQFAVQGDASSIANALKAVYPPGQAGDIVITADVSTGTVIVKAPGPQMTGISEQIAQLEKGSADVKEIRTIKIGVADAEAVATTLNQIFGGQQQGRTRGPGAVTIRGAKSAGLVYVQSSEEKFEEIKKVAISLDQNPGIQVKTFHLNHASAVDVDSKLTTMMAKAMATGGLKDTKLDLIGVVPDARTNSLIVTGGPVTFLLIEDVLKAIDQKSPEDITRLTVVYTVPGTANVAEIAANITALFQNETLPKTGVEPPTVTANAAASAVFVQASPKQHERILKDIIEPIKAQLGGPMQDFQVQVKFARADEVKQTLEASMAQWRTANGNKPQDAFTITADPNSNMLLINCSPQTKLIFDKQLGEIDKETVQLAGERKPKTYPVKWVNPQTVQAAIQSQFTRPGGARVADRDQVTVTPDAETKTVTVVANGANHTKVEELIAMMDVENSAKTQEFLYKVQNAKAADLSTTLTSQIRATRKATQGQYPVNVVADEASNTLIISASQVDFDALMVTIQSLDIAGSQRVTKAFQVKYVMPWTMASVINQQFQARGSRSPNDQVTASFEDGTGSIIVSANSKNMEEVEKIILDSDKPSSSTKLTKFIKLANARAEDVSKTINDAFRAKTVANRQGVFPVNASADLASNNVIVTATTEYMEEIEAMASNLDSTGGRTAHSYQFPDDVPAKSVVENINKLYGSPGGRDGVKAEYHEPTNTLIVLATDGEATKIEKEYIDKVKKLPATGAMKVYKIALKHVVADEVAKTLQEFFDKKAGKGQSQNLPPWMRGGGGGEASRQDNNVSIIAEPGSNMLLVNCTETTKALIDDILKDIDTDMPQGGNMVMEIVPLEYMDAAELVTLLTEYLKVSKRTPSENKEQLPWWMSDMREVTKPEQTVLAGDMRLKAIESSNSIMVAGKPERVEEVKLKIREFDKPTGPNRADVPQEIKLVNARASEMADLASKLFVDNSGKSAGAYKPIITADEGSNSLYVKAKAADVAKIREMVERIDAGMKDEPSGIKTIQLPPGRDAVELARTIQKQINDAEQDKAQRIKDYKQNKVTINADQLSNALMVSATKTQLEEVQRLIETLAGMSPAGARVRTFIPVENLTSEQAKQLIEELQQGNKGTRTVGGRSDATWTRHRRSDKAMRSRAAMTLPMIVAQLAVSTAVAQTPPAKPGEKPGGLQVVQIRPKEAPAGAAKAATTQPTSFPAFQTPTTGAMTEDAIKNFQRRLSGSPITVTTTPGGIIVEGPADDVNVVNSVLQMVDRTQPAKKIEYIQLEFAQAKNLAQTLTDALSKISRPNKPEDKVDIIADTRTNGLYIAAVPERMEEVRNLVKQNEDFASRDPGKQIRKFDLKNRRAAEAGETLKKLVTGYLRQKGLDASQISIEVDPLTNSIYVTASAGDLRVLEPLLSGIDEAPPEASDTGALRPDEADVMIVPLRIAKADSVGVLLQDMLKKAATGDTPMKDFLRRLRILDENGNPIATVDLNKPIVVVGDKDSNSLIIASSRANALIIKQIALAFDKEPARAEVKHVILTLKYADAGEVAEQINKMLTDGENLTQRPGQSEKSGKPEGEAGALVYKAVVTPDPRTNQLILVGRPDAVDLLSGVVNTLDVKGQDVMPFSIIKLEYASAGALEEALTSIFKERLDNIPLGKSENAKKSEAVIIRSDPKSKSLIVAAKAGRLEEVRDLVKKLDVPSSALIEDIRTITLKNGNAIEMAEKLKTLWEERQKQQEAGSKGPKLEIPAIVADSRSNSLIVAASKGDYEAIASVVAKIEALELNPAGNFYIVRLQNNSAKALQPALKALFEQRAKMRTIDGKIRPEDEIALEVDELTNSLILAGSKENYDVLVSKLSELDASTINEGQVEFFFANNVDAKRIKDAIDNLFKEGPFVPGAVSDSEAAKKRAKVTVTVDERANMLIVSASPENMRLVREIYTRMNSVAGPWTSELTRLVIIENGDAVKIAAQITDHFKKVDELRGTTGDNKSPFGITAFADGRSNRIVLGGTKDGIDRAAELVKQLDVPPGDPTATVQVYKLTQTRASKVGETIQAIFDERKKPRGSAETVPDLGVKIESNDTTNSMVVNATREDQILIRDLITQLDVPSSLNVRIFPLQKARAEQIKEILDKTYSGSSGGGTGGGTSGGGSSSSLVTVNADTRVNSLVVSAPPGEMENIAKVVEMLDSAEPIDTAQVGIFVCENEDAEKMAELINQIISGQGAATTGGSSGGGGAGGTGSTATAASTQAGASLISYQGMGPDGRELFLKTIRENVLVTHSERTNSVIVTAPPPALRLIEALVRKLDRIQKKSVLVKVFKLVNSDATKMVELLESMFAQEEGDDSEEEFQRGREIEVEGAGGSTTSGAPTASSQGDVAKGTFGRPKTTFTADERTNSILTAGWEEDIKVVEQVITQLDNQQVPDRERIVYNVVNGTAADIQEALQNFYDEEAARIDRLGDSVSPQARMDQEVQVVSYEESNQLVLSTSPRYKRQVLDLLEQLDQPPPQVMIQVMIAEVTLDDRFEMGMEFALQQLRFSETATPGGNGILQSTHFDAIGGTDLGAAGSGLGGVSFTLTGEDFNFLVRALQSDARLEVIQRPSVMCQNNQTANISVGQRVPIVNGSTIGIGGQSTSNVTYEEIGIILDVEPHINPDGFVYMNVRPEVSSISDSSVNVGNGAVLPIFNSRTAETTVAVKDGETVIIGGLITTTDNESESKVPVLGDLPGIGVAFRTTTRSKTRTELLIALTPQIVRTVEDARRISITHRDESGIITDKMKQSILFGKLKIEPETSSQIDDINQPPILDQPLMSEDPDRTLPPVPERAIDSPLLSQPVPAGDGLIPIMPVRTNPTTPAPMPAPSGAPRPKYGPAAPRYGPMSPTEVEARGRRRGDTAVGMAVSRD